MTFPQTEQNEKIHSDLLYVLLLGMQLGLHPQGYLPSQHAVMVNTLEDEVPTAFRVTAHTEDQNVFFHSAPFVGRSYDNIAPPAPEGLTAVVTDTIVSLSWDAS